MCVASNLSKISRVVYGPFYIVTNMRFLPPGNHLPQIFEKIWSEDGMFQEYGNTFQFHATTNRSATKQRRIHPAFLWRNDIHLWSVAMQLGDFIAGQVAPKVSP